MEPGEIDAVRACALKTNLMDVSHIEPLLGEEIHHASQWKIGEIPSQQKALDYMKSQLLEIRQSGTRPHAEIAEVSAWGHDENAVGRNNRWALRQMC